MLLHALGIGVVAKKSFGMPSHLGLDRHPANLLILDFLTMATEGHSFDRVLTSSRATVVPLQPLRVRDHESRCEVRWKRDDTGRLLQYSRGHYRDDEFVRDQGERPAKFETHRNDAVDRAEERVRPANHPGKVQQDCGEGTPCYARMETRSDPEEEAERADQCRNSCKVQQRYMAELGKGVQVADQEGIASEA